jgi:hypothetical protein
MRREEYGEIFWDEVSRNIDLIKEQFDLVSIKDVDNMKVVVRKNMCAKCKCSKEIVSAFNGVNKIR